MSIDAVPPGSSLSLPPEEMRRLGHYVIDLIVEHLSTVDSKPLNGVRSKRELEAAVDRSLPVQGMDGLTAISEVDQTIMKAVLHLDHPRFFAFIPSPSNFISVLADALASGFNVFAGSWLEAAGPSQVELITTDWLRDLCGLPAQAGGLFVPGGSLATLTALTIARDRCREQCDPQRLVAYCSDQAHSSVLRAFRVIGLPESSVRILASDDAFRLSPSSLETAIRSDQNAGFWPMCVVATVGTTNTGATDPITQLREISTACGAWLHVDGAYGGVAVLSRGGEPIRKEIGDADSIALDPHKWLFQPFETGCVLVRDFGVLRDSFAILPEYLTDLDGGEVNFCDYGLQLTRSFRALKLWLSFKVFGVAAFRAAVDRGIDLAEYAERRLRSSAQFEVVTPAQLGILTFRIRGSLGAHIDHRSICRQLMQTGLAFLSTTQLRGQTVLRMCVINPRTTERDIDETIGALEALVTQADR